jgi:hypothetical protein
MPYIKKDRRPKIDEAVQGLSDVLDEQCFDTFPLENRWGVGDMNYSITKLFHNYILRNGVRYKTAVILFGTLVCVGLELYRVIFGKYEDQKRRENGGVSRLDEVTMEDVR